MNEPGLEMQPSSDASGPCRQLLEMAAQGFLLLGQDLSVLDANQAFCDLLGIKKSEVIHSRLTQYLAGSQKDDLSRQLNQVFTHQHLTFELQLHHPQKGAVPLLLHSTKIEQAQETRAFILLTDLAPLKEKEQKLKESEERFRSLVENVEDGVFILQNNRICFTNPALSKISGYYQKELLGMHFDRLIHHEDVTKLEEAWKQRMQYMGTEEHKEMEVRAVHKGGREIHVSIVLGLSRFNGKQALSGIVKDITPRKEAEKEKEKYLRQIEANLNYIDNLIERLPVGAWIIDFIPLTPEDAYKDPQYQWHQQLGYKLIISRTNLTQTNMLGYSKKELVGRSLFDPILVDDDNARLFVEKMKERLQGERGSYEVNLKHRTGEGIHVLIEAVPTLFDAKGRAIQSIGLTVDLSERKRWEDELSRLNQQLRELSITDSLTGLANRRYFDLYLLNEWERAKREKWELSLLLIDIDFFKKYNDGYGHVAGDDCLQKVANVFKKVVKRSTDLIARYGGEEFAVILPNTTQEHAKDIAENVRLFVQDTQIPHKFSETDRILTISVGISTLHPSRKTSPSQLIRNADQALYQAKHEGRNRSCSLTQEG